MRLAGYITLACATALAWIVVRLRPEHRPVAVVLSVGIAVDVARAALLGAIRPEAHRGAPWTGALRAAGVLDSALFMAWPAALAALSLVVLARRSPWPAAAGLALAVAVVAVFNHRGEELQRVYLASELAAGFAGVVGFVSWGRRRDRPDVTAACTATLATGHLGGVVLAGPYRVGPFTGWHLAQVAYVAIFAILSLLHLGAVWHPSTPNPPRS